MRRRSCRRRWRRADGVRRARGRARVPPITLDRRSWLPPVMKMPVASSSVATRRRSLASSRTSGRRPRTSVMPMLPKEGQVELGRLVAERRGGQITTTRASAPPASDTKRGQDLALTQLVLGAADDEEMTGRGPARALGVAGMRGRIAERGHGRASAGTLDSPDGPGRRQRRAASEDPRDLLHRARRRAVGDRAAELRAAFREAVLRHHPDVSTAARLATRRTSILNRAWSELRDPLRRLHYDRRLEHGTRRRCSSGRSSTTRRRGASSAAPDVAAASPSRAAGTSRSGASVAGFRVPAEVFLAGPGGPASAGSSSTTSPARTGVPTRSATGCASPREWYRERNRIDDWLGRPGALVELDESFATLVEAGLREAYIDDPCSTCAAHAFLRRIQDRYPAGLDTAALGGSRAARPAGRVPRRDGPSWAVPTSAPRTPSCC